MFLTTILAQSNDGKYYNSKKIPPDEILLKNIGYPDPNIIVGKDIDEKESTVKVYYHSSGKLDSHELKRSIFFKLDNDRWIFINERGYFYYVKK